MARGAKEKQSSQGMVTYLRTWLPLMYDVFTAWRDRPKWEEIMADLELVARENEKLRRRTTWLTALLGIIVLWNIALTFLLLHR